MGPLGDLEGKALDTVASMNWFKNITFGQVVILLFMAAGFAGAAYMIPLHLKQIQSGYELIDANQAARGKEAHEKSTADSAAWRETTKAQWAEVRELYRELIDQKRAAPKAVAAPASGSGAGSAGGGIEGSSTE